MRILETICVAFSMFSALPVLQPEWNEKNMRYALCAFPLIGAVCGGAWWGWMALCTWLQAPVLLQAAGLCAAPALITGGIHLDGYADTCDALASCADAKRKQEILNDPHCGAFAVIRLVLYFLFYVGLCTAFEGSAENLICMALAFVLERALSGFAIAAFPLAKNTGLAHTFASAAAKRRVRALLAALSVLIGAAMLVCGGVAGGLMLAAALMCLARYYAVAQKQFGGISGDLAGWFLQKAELWMLAALVFCRMLEVQL